MADNEGNIEAKNFCADIETKSEGFFLKGLSHNDWGVKNRMSRIFNKKSGNTVMLAFDHGYIMGPTSGLERMDLTIVPLIEDADCIMCARHIALNRPAGLHKTRRFALEFRQHHSYRA